MTACAAGAHLETRVLALLKKMQTVSQLAPVRATKTKQSRLSGHLAPRQGQHFSSVHVSSVCSGMASALEGTADHGDKSRVHTLQHEHASVM